MAYQLADRLERLVKILRDMNDEHALHFGCDELRRILIDLEPNIRNSIVMLHEYIRINNMDDIHAIKYICTRYKYSPKEAKDLYERCML